MVRLPREYTLEQTPYVTKVYTALAVDANDSHNPIIPFIPWVLEPLKGPAIHFRQLL